MSAPPYYNTNDSVAKIAELRVVRSACSDCLNLLRTANRSPSSTPHDPSLVSQLNNQLAALKDVPTTLGGLLADWDSLADRGALFSSEVMLRLGPFVSSSAAANRNPGAHPLSHIRELITLGNEILTAVRALKVGFESVLDTISTTITHLTDRRAELFRSQRTTTLTAPNKSRAQNAALASLAKSKTFTATLLNPSKLLSVGPAKGGLSFLSFSHSIAASIAVSNVTKAVTEHERAKKIEELILMLDRAIGLVTASRGHLDRATQNSSIIINQWNVLVAQLEYVVQVAGKHERPNVRRAGTQCRVYTRNEKSSGGYDKHESSKKTEPRLRSSKESREEYAVWMWVGAMKVLEKIEES